jgi:hypothetical protein
VYREGSASREQGGLDSMGRAQPRWLAQPVMVTQRTSANSGEMRAHGGELWQVWARRARARKRARGGRESSGRGRRSAGARSAFIGRERERHRGEERSVITTPLMAINGGLHYGEEMGREKEVAAVSGAWEAEGTRAGSSRGAGRRQGG